MHFLSYVVIEKDTKNILRSVQKILNANQHCESCENPRTMLDWYDIGGRWNKFFKPIPLPDEFKSLETLGGNIARLKEIEPFGMPYMLFTYNGDAIEKNGYDHNTGKLKEDTEEVEAHMKKMLGYCDPDDWVVVVDCHN